MKKNLFMFYLSLVICSAIAMVSCTREESPVSGKSEALAAWEEIYDKADFHRGALKDMKRIIRGAETNFPALIEISRLVATVPFHTVPLVDIAKEAAHAENGAVDFIQIAELAILKLGGTESVTELAKLASSLKAGDDLRDFNVQYERLRKTADAETIEEAVMKVKEMVEQAKKSASSL